MVSTRSSDSKAASAAGEKHDLDKSAAAASPDAKRTKMEESTQDKTRQTTLEEAVSGQKDTAMAEAEDSGNGQDKQAGSDSGTAPKKEEAEDTDTKPKEDAGESGKEKEAEEPKAEKSSRPAEIPEADPDVPSTILEKGIIYFFFRPRVNTPNPEEVSDIARTHIILRPLSGPDARLRTAADPQNDGDGQGDPPAPSEEAAAPLGDDHTARLLALPKKVLPRSGRDRYMVFVEKTAARVRDLRDEFLPGEQHETKTQGTSVTQGAVPAAEGVYVVTATGRDSHLAYVLTLPRSLGEVQTDLGLRARGSFVVSARNPEFEAPRGAQLPAGPEYPKELQEEFRGRRWTGARPAHFDVPNAQILFIGESSGIDKATEPRKKDEKEGNKDPKEVLEEFEDEDVARMKGLADDASVAIFKDLEARAKDYPDLMTTFA